MWFVLYIFLALPLLLVAYLELSTFRRRRVLNKFNGPRGLLLMGNAHQMGKNPSGGFFIGAGKVVALATQRTHLKLPISNSVVTEVTAHRIYSAARLFK